MTRQKFGLVLGNLSEVAFEGLGDASMKCTSWFAQQRAVGGVLNQCVLEQIARVRRHTLPEQQTCPHKTVKCGLKFGFRLAHYARQQA